MANKKYLMNDKVKKAGLIDIHNHVGVDLLFYLNRHHPYAQSWSVLAREAEENGISMVGVFPMVSNLTLGLEGMRRGLADTAGALEAVPYAFENSRLVSELAMFPELAGRAIPVWMVDPGRSCSGQIAALKKLRESAECRMLKIQGTIIQSKVSELLRGGECFLDLAEEWDLPFIIHSSVRPDDEWSQVLDILAVAERRPGVRFCLAHSCRFDRAALDRVAELPTILPWLSRTSVSRLTISIRRPCLPNSPKLIPKNSAGALIRPSTAMWTTGSSCSVPIAKRLPI